MREPYEPTPVALLLDTTISAAGRALWPFLHHYAWLAGREADQEVEMPPSRALAAAFGASRPHFAALMAELEAAGWLTTRRPDRRRPLVVVLHSKPRVVNDVDHPVVNVVDHRTISLVETTTRLTTPPIGPPSRRKVDGKPVGDDETALAALVVEAFNARAGTRCTVATWSPKVVMRIREHPELTLADHVRVIAAAFERPWWKGAASPSVVYGSAEQFERQLTEVDHVDPNAPLTPEDAAGYGVWWGDGTPHASPAEARAVARNGGRGAIEGEWREVRELTE